METPDEPRSCAAADIPGTSCPRTPLTRPGQRKFHNKRCRLDAKNYKRKTPERRRRAYNDVQRHRQLHEGPLECRRIQDRIAVVLQYSISELTAGSIRLNRSAIRSALRPLARFANWRFQTICEVVAGPEGERSLRALCLWCSCPGTDPVTRSSACETLADLAHTHQEALKGAKEGELLTFPLEVQPSSDGKPRCAVALCVRWKESPQPHGDAFSPREWVFEIFRSSVKGETAHLYFIFDAHLTRTYRIGRKDYSYYPSNRPPRAWHLHYYARWPVDTEGLWISYSAANERSHALGEDRGHTGRP